MEDLYKYLFLPTIWLVIKLHLWQLEFYIRKPQDMCCHFKRQSKIFNKYDVDCGY